MDKHMKIITLWQPWASLIALNLKQYETRSWSTKYRGKIAIHAAKRPFIAKDDFTVLDREADTAWLQALELAWNVERTENFPFSHNLPLGCIVAIADLAGCLTMHPALDSEQGQVIAIAKQSELERLTLRWLKHNGF